MTSDISSSNQKTTLPDSAQTEGMKGRLTRLGNWLTQPPDFVTEPGRRRRMRLLSSFILIILAALLFNIFFALSRNVEDFPLAPLVAEALVLTVAYLLNRKGKYTPAAFVTVIIFCLVPFAVIFLLLSINPGRAPEAFMFLAIGIILAGYFLSRWYVAGIGLVLAVFIQLVPRINPLLLSDSALNASIFIIIITALTVVFAKQRDLVEADRQQELRDARDKLEVRVQERTAELEESNHLLQKEIEIREGMQLDLAKARDEAVAASQLKSQFLASMSHELRTPLNAILNYTEMMSLGMFGPVNEEQVGALNHSLESGEHLLNLINDVLDITKIQSGMLTLFVEEDIDLYKILKGVAATTETLLQNKAKSVELVTDFEQDLPKISGDKRRIRQVLLNLISNAVKFTEEGIVTLSAKMSRGDILFIVTDTGPGIPLENQEMVFDPFIQTDTGIKHGGGTGLGLPISKQLVEAHGGQMWVESEPGNGSAFYAQFPMNAEGEKDKIEHV